MCIIINKCKNQVFPKELYQECYEKHDDGFGIAYVENGTLVVDKGLFSFEECYAKIAAREQSQLLIHFRDAPWVGAKNVENCHPFLFQTPHLTEDGSKARFTFAVAHNGSLFEYVPTTDKSDTNRFVNQVLKPHFSHDPWFLDEIPGIWFLTQTIGESNKMVILRYDAEFDELDTYIINETKGEKYKGCWFSNGKFRKPAPIVTHSYSGNFASGHINYTFADMWERPDAQGWRWSFVLDCWINRVGATRQELSHRLYKPDITMRKVRNPPWPDSEGTVLDKKQVKNVRKRSYDWFRKKYPKRDVGIDVMVSEYREFVRRSLPTLLMNKNDADVDLWISNTCNVMDLD